MTVRGPGRFPGTDLRVKTPSESRCSSAVSVRRIRRIATARPSAWRPSSLPTGSASWTAGSHIIAETVLTKDNGIESRTLAVGALSDVFHIDPDTLHARFLANAPLLATAAGKAALEGSGACRARDRRRGHQHLYRLPVPGPDELCRRAPRAAHGCPGFRSGGTRLRGRVAELARGGSAARGRACRHVLSICVEVCSAAMYLDNDPGVLISACLFGDGAGAAVLSRNAVRASQHRMEVVASLVNPEERNALLFETRNGMLRNILTRPVPRLAAEHAGQVLQTVLDATGLTRGDITTWTWMGAGATCSKHCNAGCSSTNATCVTARTCCTITAT